MTTAHRESSSPTHSLSLQHGGDTSLEGAGGTSHISRDEVDEVVDSFYLDGVDTPTDDNQSNASITSDTNSDDDVYDLYDYTVSSTPASESYQSACSSRSTHLFNEGDFEHQLDLAIARYDAKPRRWSSYEQDDEFNRVDDGVVRECEVEVERDVGAESVSRLPHLERTTTRYNGQRTDCQYADTSI